MDRKILISQLKALDMRIRATGIVANRTREYAFLGSNQFQLQNGKVFQIPELDHIEFNDANSELVVVLNDGSKSSCTGGEFDMSTLAVASPKAMPHTTAELNAVFMDVYPDSKEKLFYDELAERDMVDLSLFDRKSNGLEPFTDKILAIYHENLEIRLRKMGYVGQPPANKVMDEVLLIQTYDCKCNPFRDWMESHEWDGVPRVRMWFKEIFGATAPPLVASGREDRYLGDVSEAWFIGAVRRQYRKTKHEIVPVLISPQGIGKGEGIKYMAGQDAWFIDTNADVSKPKEFLEGVRGKVIVELSESKQIRNKDSELLKAFISKTSDQLRKSYARYDEEYPRHFVFIATSNADTIFTDITGNRRYFPMYCDATKATRPIYTSRKGAGQYEVEQVWAEALQMYRNGHHWYLDQESMGIAKIVQNFCTVENTGVALVSEWLDNNPEYSQIGARVTRKIILDECFGVDPDRFVPRDIENAYRAWSIGDEKWKKIASMRVDGRPTRGFERVIAPEDEVVTTRLLLIDDEDGEEKVDPLLMMREICISKGCTELGDIFPADEVPESVLATLMEEGYVFSPKLHEYRVAFLP